MTCASGLVLRLMVMNQQKLQGNKMRPLKILWTNWPRCSFIQWQFVFVFMYSMKLYYNLARHVSDYATYWPLTKLTECSSDFFQRGCLQIPNALSLKQLKVDKCLQSTRQLSMTITLITFNKIVVLIHLFN